MSNPEFNTLEEARAEILRLNGELATARTENENYATKITELETNLENVRELNQKYFLKLSAQYTPNPAGDDTGNDEDDAPSCEDFAKTLTI